MAYPRLQLGTCRYVSFRTCKDIDPSAFAIVFGHAGDGNLHIEHMPDRREEPERLAYEITSEFGGSISAEHGIGIVKRPYLNMSRTSEKLEICVRSSERSILTIS